MEKYKSIIDEINQTINDFNKFLSYSYHIPIITYKPSSYTDLKKPWKEQDWGYTAVRGVYFIFGKHEYNDSTKMGVYIGKASLNSHIGRRLWTHLKSGSAEGNYEMNDFEENPFSLEYFTLISLDALNIGFLSPALEEFLITELSNKIFLLNRTGNK